MNPVRSNYPSASSESSIRPRNRRLISYGDDGDVTLGDAATSTSSSQPTSRPPFPSRGVSPIPGAHPSRQSYSTANAGHVMSNGIGSGRNGREHINSSSGLGLWESWSSIQSIASTLLGSDAQQGTKGKSSGTVNPSTWRKAAKFPRLWSPTPQWGPETASEQKYTAGSKEERRAMVQDKKREALLLADVNGLANSSTLHKRRDSDLRLCDSATSVEQDGDALVYVHKVKPQDTLAGVMIRYQCQPAVFRKVNRLWPNDRIQIREHVFLPVEACALRGRRVEVDKSRPDHDLSNSTAAEQCNHISSNQIDPKPDYESSYISSNTNPDHDPEYKHEYFVSIPGIPENVEIARIPRRTLGFFPPSRRKSQTYSETDLYSDSPKTSLDLTTRLNSISLNASPSRNRTNRPHRSGSGSYFVDRLKGPGGVGTLRGSGPGGVTAPGPAEDSLNKIFAHHLPNVAPRESFDSVRSASSSGLENVGGVIEGWVRKVGTRIAGSMEPAEAWRQHGGSRMGDLIELESSGDTAEDAADGVGHGTGQQGNENVIAAFDGPASGRNSRDLLKGKSTTTAGVTATEEALLRERFPPRGRMVDAQTNRRR
jgi:LysM repeat protein